MLDLEWGATPIVATSIVVLIALFGAACGLIAGAGIVREQRMLKRGVDSLRDVPAGPAASFDYRRWVTERPELINTHFADHLLSAWAAAKAGRAVSLHELHEVSARREARRRSARLSGGITGLLLVCGIAGTLLAIKPILGGFNISANADGVFEAAESAFTATKMIQDLGQAFWPSLAALIGTIVVVFLRGVYAHRRGTLAGELDQLDLEELFPRFPPPSISREFDEVRAGLGELVTTMLASQRSFDDFVKRLTGAARGFRADAPPLQDAAKRFVTAAETLSPKFDALLAALPTHFGPNAPLYARLEALDVLAQQVSATALEMKQNGSIMTEQLETAHRILQQTASDLPGQIKDGCVSAATILKVATSNAVTAACADTARSMDAAAAPVRDAAAALHAADQALRDDVATTIDTLAREVAARSLATENAIGATTKVLRDDIGSTNKALRDDIGKTLDTLALDMREHTEAMEKEFRSELKTAVATVGKMHGSAADAIAKVEATVGQLEDLQVLAEKTLAEHKEGRKEAAKVRKDMQSTANQVKQIGQQVKAVMTELSDAQQTSRTLSDRFADITSDLERLSTTSGDLYTAIAELSTAQQSAAQQINEVLGRAGQTTATWQALVDAMTRLSGSGTTLNSDFDRLLTKGREVGQLLERGTAEAARQQAELTERLASLSEAIVRLDAKRESHWVDRIFRGDR
jgi:hypothetical protein